MDFVHLDDGLVMIHAEPHAIRQPKNGLEKWMPVSLATNTKCLRAENGMTIRGKIIPLAQIMAPVPGMFRGIGCSCR
jgi:hypothetical protein